MKCDIIFQMFAVFFFQCGVIFVIVVNNKSINRYYGRETKMKYLFLSTIAIALILTSIAEGRHKRRRSFEKDAGEPRHDASMSKSENDNVGDDVGIEENCEPCRGPKKDTKSSNIAMKAAQEAKEAQEAQQIAGAQAAHQVKAQLAEKAEQAAKAAEAALTGKQAMVEQLEHEVREAEAVVQEESASYQQTQTNLQAAVNSACQAGHLLKTLTGAIQLAQSNLANSQQVAEGAQQELAEKTALVDAAKARVEALLKELSSARQDLNAIKQAAYKAQSAAKSAETNAQKSCRRRRKRKSMGISEVRSLANR